MVGRILEELEPNCTSNKDESKGTYSTSGGYGGGYHDAGNALGLR